MRNNNNNCTSNQLINTLLTIILVGMNYVVIAYLFKHVNSIGNKPIYTSPSIRQVEMYK